MQPTAMKLVALQFWYGARVDEPKSNAFNLIVKQYAHLKVKFW
jgi:hypothetical protein